MLVGDSRLTLVDCRKGMKETGVLPQLDPGGLGDMSVEWRDRGSPQSPVGACRWGGPFPGDPQDCSLNEGKGERER